MYEEPYFPVDPHVSGNAFIWKFSPSTVVVVIGHQRILLCHQCPCIYSQNFLTIHYFLKIVDAEFLLCCILCFKKCLSQVCVKVELRSVSRILWLCFIIIVRAKFHDQNVHKAECTVVHAPILCSGYVWYYHSR